MPVDSSGGAEDAAVAMARSLLRDGERTLCVDCTGFLTPRLLPGGLEQEPADNEQSDTGGFVHIDGMTLPKGIPGILTLLHNAPDRLSNTRNSELNLEALVSYVHSPGDAGIAMLANANNVTMLASSLQHWSRNVLCALAMVLDTLQLHSDKFRDVRVLIALPAIADSSLAFMGLNAADRLIAVGSSFAVSVESVKRLIHRVYDDCSSPNDPVRRHTENTSSFTLRKMLDTFGGPPLFAGVLLLDSANGDHLEGEIDNAIHKDISQLQTPFAAHCLTVQIPAVENDLHKRAFSSKPSVQKPLRVQQKVLVHAARDGPKANPSVLSKLLAVFRYTTILAVLSIGLLMLILLLKA